MLRISQAKRSFRASRMLSASLPAGPKENASFATIKLPHAPKRSDERWIFWVCYNRTGTTMLSKTLCCKKDIQKFPSVSRFVVFCDDPSDHVWGTGRETQLSKSKIRIFRIKADLDSGSVCGPTPARNLLALMAPPFLCIASCNVYNQKSDFRSGAGHGILRFFTVHRSHPFLCRFIFSMFLLCLYSIRF